MSLDNSIGFLVEGHSEYDCIPSIVSKIIGYFNFPRHNAKGIGNILKNLDRELIYFIKTSQPRHIILSLDYIDTIRQGYATDCVDLRNKIINKYQLFIDSQSSGSLTLPESFTLIIAIQKYESWICADYEGLKDNPLIDESLIVEVFNDVDNQLPNPEQWLKSKLKRNVDLKNRRYRKKIISTFRPEFAKDISLSFNRFYQKVNDET